MMKKKTMWVVVAVIAIAATYLTAKIERSPSIEESGPIVTCLSLSPECEPDVSFGYPFVALARDSYGTYLKPGGIAINFVIWTGLTILLLFWSRKLYRRLRH